MLIPSEHVYPAALSLLAENLPLVLNNKGQKLAAHNNLRGKSMSRIVPSS
jgi:hypothetical protein